MQQLEEQLEEAANRLAEEDTSGECLAGWLAEWLTG